jgi:phospholipid-transporting ATPase
LSDIRSLAIGDGANDVSMLTEANVSIGIRGVEGNQAAKASDFSFEEFKYLKRLLLYWGYENYRKNSKLIYFNIFKNQTFIMTYFWYGIYNLFSA